MNYGVIDGQVNGTEQVIFHYEVPAGQEVMSVSTGDIFKGAEDGFYTVFVRSVRGANYAYGTHMYFNNDSNSANYGYRGIYAGTSIDNIYSTSSMIRLGAIGNTSLLSCNVSHFYLKKGVVRLVLGTSGSSILNMNVSSLETVGGVWNNTTDEVRNITFGTYSFSGVPINGPFAGGSSFTILKQNTFSNGLITGEIRTPEIKRCFVRVKSVTLAEAGSSVVFDDLNGDRDYIYYIKTYVKGTGTNSNPLLRLNGDGEQNYGYNRFYTSGGTAASSKASGARWMSFCTGISGSANMYNYGSGYLFAKSGVVRCGLGHCNYNVSGSTIDTRYTYAATWQNTTANITNITLDSFNANFAAGSQFEIYALRPNG